MAKKYCVCCESEEEHEIRVKNSEGIFTLENCRNYMKNGYANESTFLNVDWDKDMEEEVIKVLYDSDEEIVILTIHMDALWDRTWDNPNIIEHFEEIIINREDFEIIKKFFGM